MRNKIFITVIILIGLSSVIFSQSQFRSGIFLHHSTGMTIWGPNGSSTSIPNEMVLYNTQKGYTGTNAVSMTETWFPAGNDNEWVTWHNLFDDSNSSIQPYLQNNKIIVIKTCFLFSAYMTGVGSPADTLNPALKTIYNYKWHWRSIIRVMQQHPENFFVIWTNAPLVPSSTNSQQASLVNQFCTWAKDTLAEGNDPIFGSFPHNVYVFDFFHKVTDENGMLRLEYATSTTDSHPNGTATELVAPQFVQEIFDAAINYESTANNTTFQLSASIQSGWNLISIPGLHPVNQNIDTWWENRDPLADGFSYSGSYQSVTSFTPGTGYWMKHTNSQTYNTGDEWPISGIQIVPHNPISAINGWNIIGGYEFNSSTADITTTPSGLQTGLIYGYSSEGYQVADNLNPGYGYWIKLTGDGEINLPPVFFKGNSETTELLKEDWGRIIFTDKAGKRYILYLAKGEVNLDEFELPPLPPDGMFDIRYSSGRFADKFSNDLKLIEMRGIEYPITVRIENTLISIQDETGKLLNTILRPGEEISINNISISKLIIAEEIIPNGYTLEQNYPNPFNPATKIKFTIPNVTLSTSSRAARPDDLSGESRDEGSRVQLKVFDVLGNEVSTLVNGFLEAGTYEIDYNASELSSGFYIYKLESGSFVQTRKMMLLK